MKYINITNKINDKCQLILKFMKNRIYETIVSN